MAIPIINNWEQYFLHQDEGLGSSYERIILNKKLSQITKLFQINTVLEAPIFGFTGISGINSMNLSMQGKKVTLLEHDNKRIQLVKKIWQKTPNQALFKLVESYEKLDFKENSFDLSWNFSALWFVTDLTNFLSELCRVTKKAIFICVPNRTGLGYLSQKINKEDEQFCEENILPKNIINIMKNCGWELLQWHFIDCPPWPDIGMSKESFLKKLKLDFLLSKSPSKPLSIMPYYNNENPNFENEMMRYYWLEKKAPDFFKKFWAHHLYLLFIPKNEKNS